MGHFNIRIEAKFYKFLRSENGAQFRIEENSKGKSRSILMGIPCLKWLHKVLQELLRGDEKKVKYSTKRESNVAFIAQERSNLHGHFVEIVEFRNGGVQGLIVIPSGRNGSGWHTFVGKLTEIIDVTQGVHERRQRGGTDLAVTKFTGAYPSFAEVVVRGKVTQQHARSRAPNEAKDAPFSKLPETHGTPEKMIQAAVLLLQRHRSEIDDLLNLMITWVPKHAQSFQPQKISHKQAQVETNNQAQYHKQIKNKFQAHTENPAQSKKQIKPTTQTQNKQRTHPTNQTQMNQTQNPISAHPQTQTQPTTQNQNKQKTQQTHTQNPNPTKLTQPQNPKYYPNTQTQQTTPVAPKPNNRTKIPPQNIQTQIPQPISKQPIDQSQSFFQMKTTGQELFPQVAGEPEPPSQGGASLLPQTAGEPEPPSHGGASLLHDRIEEMARLFHQFQSFENAQFQQNCTDMGGIRGETSNTKKWNSISTGEGEEISEDMLGTETCKLDLNKLNMNSEFVSQNQIVEFNDGKGAVADLENFMSPNRQANPLALDCNDRVEDYNIEACKSIVVYEDFISQNYLSPLQSITDNSWVLEMVGGVKDMVGIDCAGYEKELEALFIAIEEDRNAVLNTKKRALESLRVFNPLSNTKMQQRVEKKLGGNQEGRG